MKNFPLIVANTADSVGVVRKGCEKVGFDHVFCQLTATDIANVLLPELVQRRKKFYEKLE